LGSMVRIDLHGRRVGGWVVELDPVLEAGVALKPLAKLVGRGPAGEIVELAGWAAWRWAGRTAQFLRTASPPRVVADLPAAAHEVRPDLDDSWFSSAFEGPGGVVRIAPAGDRWPLVRAALAVGNPLIVTPGRATASDLVSRLRQAGAPVALLPDDWALAAAGGCAIVGTRAAAWGPAPDCGVIVVLDEHDEGLAEERSPTWNAREVLIERARRRGVPCVLVSPQPSLEAQRWSEPLEPPRPLERAGWPPVQVIDRRVEAPTAGVFSESLVGLIRAADRVGCVVNRKGRSALLACDACGEIAACTACGSALAQLSKGELTCRNCGLSRPVVCAACGATRFKNLRMGVERVRSDLEALLRTPVGEVTAGGWSHGGPDSSVSVGTEALLHKMPRADLIAFLEFDQELVAPRFRAREQALALLVRAARLVGPRERGGVVAVQTRAPAHPVLAAAAAGRPADLDADTLTTRTRLRLPPTTALAAISGVGAPAYVAQLEGHPDLEVMALEGSEWLVRAADHGVLCDGLAGTQRSTQRLRVSVDPLRV
jgi:primosomal protein N' (replication factor Y)